jgi:hypothetical protein
MIINTAIEIAQSDNPRDLLAIAHWARKELRLRTTPQILMAVAAHCPETKQYVRSYCPKVINRADELKQVFVASRSLYGSEKSLPNSLKRGLADSFAKFKEYDFLKYEGQHRPQFADVLKMIDREENWPLPKALDHYLKTGEVQDGRKTPIIAARKKLSKCQIFSKQAKELAEKSRATWEVLLSQFGNTKEVWEHLIDTDQLPYMATLRNVRNAIQAGVDTPHLRKMAAKIIKGAVKGKQLPFRYISAKSALLGTAGPFLNSFRSPNRKEAIIVDALDQAVDNIIEALAAIPGRTLVAVDKKAQWLAVSGRHGNQLGLHRRTL